eukprot:TRINITY_DN46937_c0_g1_i1.p1 TRINITY_DN46937_c0_g1~~TRINITY_DN46937_c0_g1_i1.p1  ORF type:complete len:651 (+),score=253.98 TRINITY_DN46937_c0_g1_i1:76-2028(+)
MVLYNFKQIAPVPRSKEFVDIILSKTQRKTPTVVHKGYQISRIRGFYMRKVKFTQTSIHEKLSHLLDNFPRLDDVHPFYAELMNVLYDRDHYKVALGQVNTTRHLIDALGRDYVRLLKYGDSLYRCKSLKRAALGRMATLVKKLDDSLGYLEQVRQHLSRLPSIDPNTRTLIVCGFPNVGKSSFMNKVTRADVDVQPYAFTTKSLFVGHTDYRFMSWQVIDTPGVLDHPLDQCSTIEMQSITALAHLKATVMYFMDMSCQCGYSVEQQVSLFRNISPLFANKPLLVVLNKVDLLRFADASMSDQMLVKQAAEQAGAEILETSTLRDVGVGELKVKACELLLASRQEAKVRSKRYQEIENRVYCAVPDKRDDRERDVCIPESVLRRREALARGEDLPRRQTERDLEAEGGGPGVYQMDLRKNWMLEDDDWKYDPMPEVYMGMNVADWIDPDIEQRLAELEEEEERRLEEEALAAETAEPLFRLDRNSKEALRRVREQLEYSKLEAAANRVNGRKMASHVQQEAVDRHQKGLHKDRSVSTHERVTGRKRGRSSSQDAKLELIGHSQSSRRSSSKTRLLSGKSRSRDRGIGISPSDGLRSGQQMIRAMSISRMRSKAWRQDSRRGEDDKHHYDMKPKWAFSGKMKVQGKRHCR